MQIKSEHINWNLKCSLNHHRDCPLFFHFSSRNTVKVLITLPTLTSTPSTLVCLISNSLPLQASSHTSRPFTLLTHFTAIVFTHLLTFSSSEFLKTKPFLNSEWKKDYVNYDRPLSLPLPQTFLERLRRKWTSAQKMIASLWLAEHCRLTTPRVSNST